MQIGEIGPLGPELMQLRRIGAVLADIAEGHHGLNLYRRRTDPGLSVTGDRLVMAAQGKDAVKPFCDGLQVLMLLLDPDDLVFRPAKVLRTARPLVGGDQFRLGVALGLLTGVAYAIYMLTTRHAQIKGKVPLPAPQLLCVMSLLCAAMLGLAILFEGDSLAMPDLQTWWALLGLALIGQVLGWLLLLRAIPWLPASIIGLLLLLQPAMSFVLDVLLFDRATSASGWVGVGLSMIGIFVGSRRPARKPESGMETTA